MSLDEEFMGRAMELAQQAAAVGEVPVGALVVKEGRVIGEGYNQPITSCDPTGHAEIIAIQKAGEKINNYRLVDCDLFVTLEPCLMCLGAILHARIRNVYFAASDNKTGACGGLIDLTINNSLNHHCNFHKGILSKESTDLIQNFFQEKRAKKNRT